MILWLLRGAKTAKAGRDFVRLCVIPHAGLIRFKGKFARLRGQLMKGLLGKKNAPARRRENYFLLLLFL